MVKVYDNAPEWFARKDYGYLGGLDAAEWLHELKRCAHLANEAAKREAGEPTFEEEWKEILSLDIAHGALPGYIGPPPVRVVDKVDQASLYELEKPALFLQLWLGASNVVIIAAIEHILLHARETHPSPVKKPGTQALTGTIGKTEFHRWRRHKIVEISELFDWGSREDYEVKNADLGRWLFGDRKDPDRYACKALEVRQRAFDLIPALWSQTLLPSKPKRGKRSR